MSLSFVMFLLLTVAAYIYHFDVTSLFWILLEFLGLMILSYNLIEIKSDFDFMIDVIRRIAFIISLSGIIQFIFDFNIFDPIRVYDVGGANGVRFGMIRIYGPCTTSNNYGLLMVLISGLLLFYLIRNDRNPIFHKLTYSLVIANVFLTISRTAIVFMLVSSIAILLLSGYKFLFRVLMYLLVFAIGILLVINFLDLWDEMRMILNIWYSIRAIFDSEYATILGNEAFAGGGEREDLVNWVNYYVDDKQIFGLGGNARFSHFINRWRTKTSIENSFLSTYFHYGYVGVSGLVSGMVGIIGYLVIHRKRKVLGECTIPINYCSLILYTCYFISLLTFGYMDERRLYIYFLGSLFAINKKVKSSGLMSSEK